MAETLNMLKTTLTVELLRDELASLVGVGLEYVDALVDGLALGCEGAGVVGPYPGGGGAAAVGGVHRDLEGDLRPRPLRRGQLPRFLVHRALFSNADSNFRT